MGDEFDQWVTDYRPIPNPDGDSGFVVDDQCVFYETYGDDLKAVESAFNKDPATVWTILDVDGELFLSDGYHWVNRFGYLITEHPHIGDSICIKID